MVHETEDTILEPQDVDPEPRRIWAGTAGFVVLLGALIVVILVVSLLIGFFVNGILPNLLPDPSPSPTSS